MKKYNLIIKEEAKEDIFEAYNWYEDKQTELGERFLNIIDEYFKNISLYPQQYHIEFDNMRKAIVKKFPFIIVFGIENNDVVVFAVFHTKQNPDKIKYK